MDVALGVDEAEESGDPQRRVGWGRLAAQGDR
jgi:hypothetical protein